MKKHLLLATSLMLIFNVLLAAGDDDPAFKLTMGSKHIYPDKLGLSPNTLVIDALQLLPELNMRGYDDIIANFSVSVDGNSLGSAKDQALYQMTVGELSEIEINDNPASAWNSDGVCGSINLKTRSFSEGVSGNAQLDVSTEPIILSSATVNYKKDKIKVSSSLKWEFYNLARTSYNNVLLDNILYSSTKVIDASRGGGEIGKVAVTYTPGSADELKFSFWESYSNDKADVTSIVRSEIDTTQDIQNSFNALFIASYTHKFGSQHKITVEGNYNFQTTRTREFKSVMIDVNRPDRLNLSGKYTGTLFKSESSRVDLKAGVNFSYVDTRHTPAHTASVNTSPYFELEYDYGREIAMKLSGKYIYNRYNNFNNPAADDHDWMLRYEILYSPVASHWIRWSAMRNMLGTSLGKKTGYVCSTDLNYVFEKQFGEHLLNTSTEVQYDYTNRIFGTGTIDFHTFSANHSVFWRYQWFSLGFAATYFANFVDHSLFDDDDVIPGRGQQSYYNLRLTPFFRLPQDWSLSATLMYNSKVYYVNGVNGSAIYTTLRVSKQVQNWNLHAELCCPYNPQTTDSKFEGRMRKDVIYNEYMRYLNVGVTCNF